MSTRVNATHEASEIVEVEGNKLVQTVKGIFTAGKFNRIIISSVNGTTLLDIPYRTGLTVAALASYLLPPLAVLTPALLLIARFKIEIIREKTEEESTLAKAEVEVEIEAATTSEQPESDKLEDIAGIGKIFGGRLRNAGIRTFAQLAEQTPEQISEIVSEEKSVPISETQEWIDEAAQLGQVAF